MSNIAATILIWKSSSTCSLARLICGWKFAPYDGLGRTTVAVSDLDITFHMLLLHKCHTLYPMWRRSSAFKEPGCTAHLWHSSPADDVVSHVFNGMKVTMNENDC